MDDMGDRGQCFSCGFFGHGVNRCPQLNIFPLYNAGMVGGRTGRTVPRLTNARRPTGPPAGKIGMVRAGGSASRTISDSDTPDPGGGHHLAWKRPKDDTHGPR